MSQLFSLSEACFSAKGSLCARVARWFIFKPKNPNLGKIWRDSEWKNLLYLMTICDILLPFGSIHSRLVWFVVIWYIFSRFGMFGPKKIWQPCSAHGSLQTM
jgi:hypothetical protein